MNDPLLFTPGPVNLHPTVLRAMVTPLVFHRAERFHKLYSEIEEKLRKVLLTENSEIYLLTTSGTGSIEAAIANFVKPGDKILVSIHGVFSERLAEAVKVYGGKVVPIFTDERRGPYLSEIENKMSEDIRVAAFVLNDTCPGILLKNFEEIVKLVKEYGCLLLVDAVSILGGYNIPIDKWGIDVLVAATQKCLAAPPGISLITISEEAMRILKENKPRSYYLNLKKYVEFAKRRETPFTPAISTLYALNEALNIILKVGYNRWIKFHEIRANALYSSLEILGLKPFVKEEFRSNTIITLELADEHLNNLVRLLRREFEIYIAGGIGKFKGKVMRVGNMGYLTKRDVLTLLASIGVLLEELGYSPNTHLALRSAFQKLKDLNYQGIFNEYT